MDTKEKELEERIESLTEKRTMFLVFGISAIVLGCCSPFISALTNSVGNVAVIVTLLTLFAESLVGGGVVLIVLRSVILGRRLKRAQKELNEIRTTKKEIEIVE